MGFVALVFTGIASARIVATYSQLSVTYDEPPHLACGLEYLTQHTYKLETQHLPSARRSPWIPTWIGVGT